MTTSPVSIVIADDHPFVLLGVAGLLQAQSDMNVVATCNDGEAALKAIRQYTPDVAVLDIAMPGLNGLEVLSSVAADRTATKIVFLTATAKDDQILAAITHGAKGLMLKDKAAESLIDCIRQVAAGKRWLPAEVVDIALEREIGHQVESERLVQVLTLREREITALVSEGLSNKQLARRLDLTEGTVKIHLHNIYEKLSVPNRTTLTALAITHRDRLTST